MTAPLNPRGPWPECQAARETSASACRRAIAACEERMGIAAEDVANRAGAGGVEAHRIDAAARADVDQARADRAIWRRRLAEIEAGE